MKLVRILLSVLLPPRRRISSLWIQFHAAD